MKTTYEHLAELPPTAAREIMDLAGEQTQDQLEEDHSVKEPYPLLFVVPDGRDHEDTVYQILDSLTFTAKGSG